MNRLVYLASLLLCFANLSADEPLRVSPRSASQAAGLNVAHPGAAKGSVPHIDT